MSLNQRSRRPSGSGGPRHLEEGYYRSFGSKDDEFFSLLFLVKKRDRTTRLVVNLKCLNSNILHQHFKVEEFFLINKILLPEDKMCKIGLKDAQKTFYTRFVVFVSRFLRLLCSSQVPISILRKPNIRIITYLDDMLLMASSLDTLIFILQL